MKKTLSNHKIMPKKMIFGGKAPSLLKVETTLQSINVIVVDVIHRNQGDMHNFNRSERFDR